MRYSSAADRLFDAVVYDEAGRRVGAVDSVYVDDRSDEPTWVTLLLGLLGRDASYVPLVDARIDGERISVPYSRSRIRSAPRIDPRQRLYPNEERRLLEHYGRQPRAD